MKFKAVIKELSTGLATTVEFPASLEEIAEKLGLTTTVFEYIILSSSHDLASEHDSIELLNKFCELTEGVDEDLVEAVQEVLGYKAKDFVEYNFDFDSCSLLPDVTNLRELGEHTVDEIGFENIPRRVLECHFDHEGYGRDLDIENQGGFSSKGYVNIW